MGKRRKETFEEALDRLHHFYEKTQNPLYVWEAIARALNANKPIIPDWCVPYLREAAGNLTHLASVREGDGGGILPRISSNRAVQ